ncbi:MAG: GntR family transcriptional regulator [Lachnospiraceae bacterium]
MIPNLKVPMNEYLPLRDVVFQTLRQAILKGELLPGERLMEVRLANALGVSRTPVREAIHMLELEGLVVMVPRKGAEVARISEKNLYDVLEVRRALEKLAVELVCQRMSEEQLNQLKQKFYAFLAVAQSEDLMQVVQCDEEFHDVIYEATGNIRLVQMLNNLREQMYRYRLEHIKDLSKRSTLVKEHKRILDALTIKDVEAAKSAIEEHINNQMSSVAESIHEEEKEIKK